MKIYKIPSDQLSAYEQLISVYLYEYIENVVKNKSVTETPFEKYKGIVVSLEEAENIFSETPFTLSEKSQNLIEKLYQEIVSATKASIENGVFLPFEYICSVFSLSELESFIVLLSALPLINPDYSKTYSYINDNVKEKNPTLGLALRLFSGGRYHLFSAFKDKLLKYIFDIDFSAYTNPADMPLKLRGCIGDFILTGNLTLNHDFLSEKAVPQFEPDEKTNELSRIIKAKNPVLINITGEKGIGKKHLCICSFSQIDENVLFIDYKRWQSEKTSYEDLYTILTLRQASPCIFNAENSDSDKLEAFIEKISAASPVLVVCSEEILRINTSLTLYAIALEKPDREKSFKLWNNFSLPIEDDFLWNVVNKYKFTPEQINEIIAFSEMKAKAEGLFEITEKLIDECCNISSSGILRDKAELIETKFSFDDLVLPPEEKSQISEGCAHIKYRHIVYDKWGFEKKLAYGKGLVMLFAGPPGTGKTMAAGIVARELGLPAYRVDISKVVSKYIGETEKSLGEIFDIAERNNAVLFFDETDAIFGKRSEIKDSHDKYANVETSYLLQRLESFDGIVLMSTNFLQNIDEAFIRRINYIIRFPFPDASQRLLLWKKIFPEEMPLSENVDLEYLAEKFELSGAAIKTCVMSAAFLAVEDGEISMYHILKAIKKQYSKQGKILIREDFGKYSVYLEE